MHRKSIVTTCHEYLSHDLQLASSPQRFIANRKPAWNLYIPTTYMEKLVCMEKLDYDRARKSCAITINVDALVIGQGR